MAGAKPARWAVAAPFLIALAVTWPLLWLLSWAFNPDDPITWRESPLCVMWRALSYA